MEMQIYTFVVIVFLWSAATLNCSSIIHDLCECQIVGSGLP